MTGSVDRLTVCYCVPGHNLLPSAGPTRNVLNLADSLAEWADVTVAFRRVLDRDPDRRFACAEIQSDAPLTSDPVDDASVRGVGYMEFLSYLRSVRRFVAERLPRFDVVLEKTWLLSGGVSALCRRRGIPAVPVENRYPVTVDPLEAPAKAAKQWVARSIAGRMLRAAPIVVVETDALKRAVVERWGLAPEDVRVIGVGVDRDLFRPRDQEEARRTLGMPTDGTVLLYVGVLDRIHDLTPVVDAVRRADVSLELHVVGDGEAREALERRAAGEVGTRIHFHGRVPHDEVPRYIAAADLCLAPYDPSAFPGGEVGYSTMKVREYLSSGRPVATVASGGLEDLVEDGVSGFVLENDGEAWHRLLVRLPPRSRLREMGRAAASTPLETWRDVAMDFRSVCEGLVTRRRRVREPCA